MNRPRPAPLLGGERALYTCGALGIAGWIGTGIGFIVDLRRALFAYLFAFTFWMSLLVCGLMWLGIWNASHAKWPVVLRRPLETAVSAVWLLPVLYLPIALGVNRIYLWAGSTGGLSLALRAHVAHDQPYLNTAFFNVRALVYFAIWIAVAEVLLRWSRAQDESGDLQLTRRQWVLGAGSVPIVAFMFNFAVIDWVMSLEPTWSSGIFALYLWTGGTLAAIALLAISACWARGPDLFGAYANENHLASLGKLLLGFTAFWFYVAFDQYMLVWIADLPSEIHWFHIRVAPPWRWVSVALFGFRFGVPFFMLLSRRLKMSRVGLTVAAAWIFAAHVLDVYWCVLPAIDVAGMRVRYTDVFSFFAIGGCMGAFTMFRMRGGYTVPIGDPYFLDSLRYSGK